MIKFWVQVIKDTKLQVNFIYTSEKKYNRKDFFEHLVEICYELNIATPILNKHHFDTFEEFRSMTFLPRDFVEETNFDKMIIEDVFGR